MKIEYGKICEEKENILDNFDLNKANVLLGRSEAVLRFFNQFSKIKDKENLEFLVLPVETYHHSNYINHFKGALIEHTNPFVLIQNKEFLEDILNMQMDKTDLVHFDFNVTQMERCFLGEEEKETLLFKTFSKEKAKNMINNNID